MILLPLHSSSKPNFAPNHLVVVAWMMVMSIAMKVAALYLGSYQNFHQGFFLLMVSFSWSIVMAK